MKKKILLFLIIFIVILIGATYGILNYPYSKGVRSGKLVKISRKGMVIKSYEGILDLGSGDQLTWQFSVHNKRRGERLAKLSGKYVRLEYRELLYKLFYDTKYDITSVEREDSKEEDQFFFCRLVNIMRKKRSIVEKVKPLVEQSDPELLHEIRRCQQ